MIKMTRKAKAKAEEMLEESRTHADEMLRLLPSQHGFREWEFILDNEKDRDAVIYSEKGIKILAVNPDQAQELEGRVLDFISIHGKSIGFAFVDECFTD